MYATIIRGSGRLGAAPGAERRDVVEDPRCSCRTGCSPSLRRTSLNICGRSRTWQTVHSPSRASATATPLRPCATRSNSISASRRQLRDDLGRARGQASSSRSSRRARRRAPCARAPTAACSLLECRFGRLQLRGERFGLLHVLEELVFVRAHFVLGDRHLLLHRLVFLVGLDLHQLSLVLGQAALDGGELLLDLPPCGLARPRSAP